MSIVKAGNRIRTRAVAVWQTVKPVLLKLWSPLKPYSRIIFTFLAAYGVTLFTEITNRRSLFKALAFSFVRPHLFIFNLAIVFFTLSISLLLKKRKVWLLLISLLWIGFGVTDFIMRSHRVTPFAAIDFALLESVWSIMLVYMRIWQMILIAASILAALTVIIILFIKSKKESVDFKQAACSVVIAIALLFGISSVYHRIGIFPDHFGNLPDAYRDYGFVYCYTVGIFDRGVDKPSDYSDENVDEILNSIGASSSGNAKTKPNIIMVQLESFFDVNYLNYATYSEDPVPNFTALKKKYSNGFLQVPSIGSGTANTEFEILTGMSLDYFGSAEYPYKTVMQHSACETIAYNLKEQGYGTHAVHNHSGNFYDRHRVFANMGFDTFTSLEYIENLTYNPIGWAEDSVLTNEIVKALDSTDYQDFVYAITVQGHGKYPSEPLGNEEPIEVYGIEDPAEATALKYFINQIHETDRFIGALIEALEARNEPYIVCLYGDHLPSLDITQEEIKNGDLFDTEYVIWTNVSIERKIKDLDSYQLSAYVMELAGFSNGIFTKLHQNYSNNENYQSALEMLEYDVLYGEYNAYGGKQKYQPTDIKMGVDDIVVRAAFLPKTGLTVLGENFTTFSTIEINGRRVETEFISPNEINAKVVIDDRETVPEKIAVLQVAKDGEEMSRVWLSQ